MAEYDIILINPPYHKRNGSSAILPLGLGYIYSYLKNLGFSVSIWDLSYHINTLNSNGIKNLNDLLYKLVSKNKPKLAFGIGPCTTSSVRSIKIISDICSKTFPSIPKIFGGPLASIHGQESIFFDEFNATALVPGDGEIVLANILSSLKENNTLEDVDGVITSHKDKIKCNVIKDLDSLPFPYRNMTTNNINPKISLRRDLFQNPFTAMITSRGCPYNCNFCASSKLRDNNYDKRSYNNIIKEINYLINQYNTKSIIFYDDMFFSDPNTLEIDIKDFIKSSNNILNKIVWQFEIRPNVLIALDSSLAKLLYENGCRQINIGVEKSNISNLTLIGKKYNPENLKRSCQKIHNSVPYMRLTGTFIIGGPDETFDTIKDTIDYSCSLDLLFAHFYPLEIYPGTEIYKSLSNFKDDIAWYDRILKDELPWGEIIYENDDINIDNIFHLINQCYKIFYNRDSWHKLANMQLDSNYINVKNKLKQIIDDRFNVKGLN